MRRAREQGAGKGGESRYVLSANREWAAKCEELERQLANEKGRKFVDMETWCRLHGWAKQGDESGRIDENLEIAFEDFHENMDRSGQEEGRTEIEEAEDRGRFQCCPEPFGGSSRVRY